MSIRLPPLEELALNWLRIEPLLRKATSITSCYEPIDVLQLAMAGRVGIWICGDYDAVIVTKVKEYPRRRLLEMVFCGGGNMRGWLDEAIRIMDEHAQERGCALIVCVGRPGWERAWKGKRTGAVVMVRELKGICDG